MVQISTCHPWLFLVHEIVQGQQRASKLTNSSKRIAVCLEVFELLFGIQTKLILTKQ